MKVSGVCHTDGSGFWSSQKKAVEIIEVGIDPYIDDNHGELKAYFSTESWNTEKDGFIYTDKLWLAEFQKLLKNFGFSTKAVSDIDYSEHGMQGYNFVSMDAGGSFMSEWKKFNK